MRMALLPLLIFATTLQAATEPMCGSDLANEQRVRALRETLPSRGNVRALGDGLAAAARDGAIYVQNNETFTPGRRVFDLNGQSLVFTPAGTSAYTVRREALRYAEPAGAPLRDFQTATGADWHYAARDLAGPYSIFGRSVTRIYVSAFNGIHLDPPAEAGGMHFDALEAAVHRTALLSPLMTTVRKPRQLHYPRVYVDERPGAVVVTWRSSNNAPFGYDVQAELRSDGRVTYSYRSMTNMQWGTPILTPGFDPAAATRTLLAVADDAPDTGSKGDIPVAAREMLNFKRVEVARVNDSDLFVLRIQLGGGIDRTKLADGEMVIYHIAVNTAVATVEVDRNQMRVVSLTGFTPAVDSPTARVDGDVLEIYGLQARPDAARDVAINLYSFYRSLSRTVDLFSMPARFTPAPRVVSTDLSAAAPTAAIPLPVIEPFVLGAFDPWTLWEVLQPAFALSDYDYDGVLMYQTFYTDIIFYAGGYAARGNPQVNGIAPYSPFYNVGQPRNPTLMHMNQLTYNYSTAEQTASKLMLHEFGHRWLYFFSIRENNQTVRPLNPVSAHPAAFVHTPAAFPVYGPEEASVMGGAHFTLQGDGSWKARSANLGYSWTDLYLMGLAAPEEVAPWFYLANTAPALPKEYWPPDGSVVTGERREVALSQITAVHGLRNPPAALAQKRFRVLFVLVTEEGVEATGAEVAKVNEWRALMERNFFLATGGRARVLTTYVRPFKTRAVR